MYETTFLKCVGAKVPKYFWKLVKSVKLKAKSTGH